MQVRVPPPGLMPIERATEATIPVVTTFPPASSMATATLVANCVPAVELPGWATKPSLTGAPVTTLKTLLVVLVKAGDEVTSRR